ncbi:hypothetical protein [Oligoflexus tunisiensis]|uniref:hypothetical protein n=1 Tax=Oligoflexus tunisiensis TaxID=708132 RepID=UPI00114CB639|nr:hypothetical protein [Oligoflexus tunisiensis]
MKRPRLVVSLVAALTLGASLLYLYKNQQQTVPESGQNRSPQEVAVQASEQENIQELVARAQSIAADYRQNHPEAAAQDETLAKIQEAVHSEAEQFEKVRSEVEAASRDVQVLREELNAAILNNIDKDKLTELNERFEEKAVALQEQQKRLENAYLEVAKAYDEAINTYL